MYNAYYTILKIIDISGCLRKALVLCNESKGSLRFDLCFTCSPVILKYFYCLLCMASREDGALYQHFKVFQ